MPNARKKDVNLSSLLVLCPSKTEPSKSVSRFLCRLEHHGASIVIGRGCSDVSLARNAVFHAGHSLCKTSGKAFSHVLLLDDDNLVKAISLIPMFLRLLDGLRSSSPRGEAVLLAPYHSRSGTGQSVSLAENYLVLDPARPVSFCSEVVGGLGFAFLSFQLFDALCTSAKVFSFANGPNGDTLALKVFSPMFLKAGRDALDLDADSLGLFEEVWVGEDVSFCIGCWRANVPVYSCGIVRHACSPMATYDGIEEMCQISLDRAIAAHCRG